MSKLVLVFLILATLVACGGTPAVQPGGPTPGATVQAESTTPPGPAATAEATDAVPAAERTTIRFAVSDFELPMYADMIEAFEAENPALHVEPVSMQQVLVLGALAQTEVPEDAEQRLAAAA
ncbi:MAG: hypothetical protein EHM56_12365, partial [Chloroflexi bacterium]